VHLVVPSPTPPPVPAGPSVPVGLIFIGLVLVASLLLWVIARKTFTKALDQDLWGDGRGGPPTD
jgi:hypothetical protein